MTTTASRSGRDWFVDVTAFVWAVALGWLIFWSQPNLDILSPALLWVDAISGMLCCLALWGRRRWPVEVAVLTALVSTFSALSVVACLIALFSLAVHRRGRVIVALVALNLAAAAVFELLRPDPTTTALLTATISVLAVTGTVAWGMFIRARRQLVLSLQERAERAEAEQQLRVDQARQLERTRIAREMHDVLAHRISLVSMHAGALEFRAEAVGGDVARSAAVIRSAAHQALEDLREVIGVLRDGTDDQPAERPQPTLDDVPGLIEESQRAGMHVSLRLGFNGGRAGAATSADRPGAAASSAPASGAVGSSAESAGGRVPLSVGRTAYRIVQEGLTNARKHAPGAAVTVELGGGPGPGLTVAVRNRRPIETRSATEIPGAGQGLVGLTERAGLAGGHLEHGRAPDGDFLLTAWLPWSA